MGFDKSDATTDVLSLLAFDAAIDWNRVKRSRLLTDLRGHYGAPGFLLQSQGPKLTYPRPRPISASIKTFAMF